MGALASAGVTTLVSRRTDRARAGESSVEPSASASGQRIAFVSMATMLTWSGATLSGGSDIFIHDHEAGQTTLVSRALNSTPAGGANSPFHLGRRMNYVAFESPRPTI